MSTRNPSPPGCVDVIESADKIGDTSYSRKWLFSLLVKLLKSIKDTEFDVCELDSDLEEELCCLWDLTVNREVTKNLEEFELVSTFSEILSKPLNSRLAVNF